MEVTFRFAVRSDLGTVRTNNEDSALASSNLLVLADGMGGHAAGEVASTVATRVFAQLTDELPDDDDTAVEDVVSRITHAGRSTRSALQQMSDADPLLESMGTTLLAVVSHAGHVTVGHIGDSRVYALRGSSLYQVTTDHTHVQRLVDTGQLTPEKARTHPYRAMLLRSLDDQPGGPDLDVIALEIEPGDRLLLCSDGLSDYLAPEEIGEVLAHPDREEAAERLIDAALRVGTRDNVTVVVADVVGEPSDGVPPELAGAVIDGLELSEPASAALRETLPALAALIVREPGLRSVGEPTVENEVSAAVEPEPEPDPHPAEPVAAEPEPVEPEPVAPEPVAPAAAEPAEPPVPAEPAPVSAAVEQRHSSDQRESVVPAVLASALLALVTLAMWFIL
ncbi:PP2C family protein-serine/threonine phosphatase [Pseudactinotalea suaedae]|uniref:PP2C family protein-serine/threonine phosphatase n=1 Tax=Pseudactinotalea suaedae TaxID=1524924 RepID=UPI0012E1F626|nr:protein phosphatase 2C domain-containing protein [Pseudactinotalea suaedae]